MPKRKAHARQIRDFQKTVLGYYRAHGRSLPWRRTTDPYRIFVSELMLQQTQVQRVIPKYQQFIKEFPNFASLAKAPLDRILGIWQGLGYNRRALYLKRVAQTVIKDYRGDLPSLQRALVVMPGIGSATAAAIMAFAFNHPTVFLETNIRSAYIHYFFPRRRKVSDRELIPLVKQTLDAKDPRRWYSALMDYGSMLKARLPNPSRRSAHHSTQSPFRGSRRELRGKVLRLVAANSRGISKRAILSKIRGAKGDVEAVLAALEKEGFIRRARGIFVIY